MKRYQQGFTLIEIILATTLVVLGVVAVVKALSSGIAADNSIDGRTVAVRLAQEEMETVKDSTNTTFSYIDTTYASSASPITEDNSTFSSYNREVDVTSVDTGLTQVTVIVKWNYKSKPMTVSLETLIGDSSVVPSTVP